MRDLGRGAGYAYDHDAPEAFSGQDYFPPGMARSRLYAPTDRGAERALAERMAELERLRAERRAGQGAAGQGAAGQGGTG